MPISGFQVFCESSLLIPALLPPLLFLNFLLSCTLLNLIVVIVVSCSRSRKFLQEIKRSSVYFVFSVKVRVPHGLFISFVYLSFSSTSVPTCLSVSARILFAYLSVYQIMYMPVSSFAYQLIYESLSARKYVHRDSVDLSVFYAPSHSLLS